MRTVEKMPYPAPIPFPRLHRCGHPVVHSLVVVGLLVGWLWFSIATKGTWGLKVAAWLDPRKVGYGLPLAVFTELFWLVLIPFGGLALYFLAMWRCTGARPRAFQPLVAAALQEPAGAVPRMVERVILTDDEAARHGLPHGTIVERIHY